MAQAANTYAPTDNLSRYFNEIKNHELLSRQQERMLASRYQEADDYEAADRLIQANLRLVVKIARDYYKKKDRFSLDDLIQEGNLGLLQAAKRFDPEKQTKFSYYAVFWIKAYIFKFLMDNYSTVKIGTTQAQRKLFFNLRKTKEKLRRQGLSPTADRVARRIGVKQSEVEEMEKRMDREDRSLEEPNGVRSQEQFIDNFKADDPSVEEVVAGRQKVVMLQGLLATFRTQLTEREIAILEQRIVAEEPLTLQNLGNQFCVSRERIRQIEAKIIKKLRAYIQANIPDFSSYVVN